MERLRQHAKSDGDKLLRYSTFEASGHARARCHTGPLVHASHPCCMQARMNKAPTDKNPADWLRQEGQCD